MDQNYVIITASTSDLTREYLDAHQIPFIPYTYLMNGEAFEDDCREETRQEIYRKMREGAELSTSAVNTYTFHSFLEPYLKEGKDIILLDMSAAITSSHANADQAIEQLKEEYPDRKVVNVDTRCISGGLGLLVEQAVDLYEKGASFDEVLQWVEANKLKVAHRFTVDDLKWLRKGGRVSNISAFVGSILAIKPVLYVPDEGTLVGVSKVRGRKNALNAVIESIKKDIVDPDGMVIRINHADCMEDAQYVRGKLLELYPSIKEITITGLGAVIGAHCGPGLFTIFYMAEKRNAK